MKEFFVHLQDIQYTIFNVDETGFSIVQSEVAQVIGRKGTGK